MKLTVSRHPCKGCGVETTNPTYCAQTCYHAHLAVRNLAAFWERVDKTETCWLWMGQRIPPNGYGMRRVHHRKMYTHRLAWEMVNGPIPKGMLVMHTCDNPPCVRPDHLVLGTSRQNTQDMLAKGRGRHQKVA